MSINDINNAAAAMNQLKARYEGFLDSIDADIAMRQAAYTALSGNLIGVLKSNMDWSATVDPDIENPTRIDGGTFNTVKDAIENAPQSARCNINLTAGKVHVVSAHINAGSRALAFYRTGAGVDPIVDFKAHVLNGYNRMYGIAALSAQHCFFQNITLQLPIVKLDDAFDWVSDRCVVSFGHGRNNSIGFNYCTVIGGEGLAIASCLGGSIVHIAMLGVTFDGPIFAARSADTGVVIIAKQQVTLLNGAALTDGGTIGTNILQN